MISGAAKGFVFGMVGALLAAACSPTVTTHGNMISGHKIAAITPQVSTRMGVAQVWGPPSAVSSFDDKVWYYIGETTSQKGVFEADVVKRQIIRVTFDEADTVVDVAQFDAKSAQEIEMVSRKTPSAGKDYTVVQQFIGNLGKFNKPPTPGQ